jgi:hypothetical protein
MFLLHRIAGIESINESTSENISYGSEFGNWPILADSKDESTPEGVMWGIIFDAPPGFLITACYLIHLQTHFVQGKGALSGYHRPQ